MAQTHLKMAQTHLKLKMAQTRTQNHAALDVQNQYFLDFFDVIWTATGPCLI